MNGNELIGTCQPAPRQMEMALASWQSWDYCNSAPYPTHAFGPTQWPRDKGPIPTALPYCQMLITEGAEFVFRNGGPLFSTPDDPEADALLQRVIADNQIDSLWVSLAEMNGNQGALAAKFSIDLENEACPIRFSFLKIPQECRVWADPHDRSRLLMARIQYPYRDIRDGCWYYYREEWTDDLYVTYEPMSAGKGDIGGISALPGYRTHLGDTDEPTRWVVHESQSNPFGLIPVTVIRNRASAGNPLGEGDCWRVFRLIDRIALTLHGEDKANQMHSEPIPVAINARIENEGPLLPGEPMSVLNEDPNKSADFKLIEPSGQARRYSQAYVDKMEDLLYRAVGISRVNLAEIGNKGNLTALAFAMIYARTIGTSDRKREMWGKSGMSPALARMLLALNRLGGVSAVRHVTPATVVSCEWPAYFQETPQDLVDTTDRTVKQVNARMLTLERGAERIARAEKLPANEIRALLAELSHNPAVPAVADTHKGTAGADIDGTESADIAETGGVNNFTG